jgi:hypothetical protein
MKDHEAPCEPLNGFKKLMIGTLSLQGVFVIASLSLCVNSMNRVSAIAEKQIQIIERQKMIEQKADTASKQSAEALATSSRAEANIQWIREGLTELKMTVRQALADKGGNQ